MDDYKRRLEDDLVNRQTGAADMDLWRTPRSETRIVEQLNPPQDIDKGEEQ